MGSYNVKDFIAPGQGAGIRQPKSAAELKALAQTLKEADCDIVALQEVGSKKLLEQFVEQRLDGAYKHVAFVPGNDRSGLSLAVISKYPILQVVTHRGDRIPRADGRGSTHFTRDFLRADIKVNDETLTVYNTHGKARLGESSTEYQRIDEARAARTIVLKDMAPFPKRLYVVSGDMNDNTYNKSVQTLAKGDGRGTQLKDTLQDKPRDQQLTWLVPGQERGHQFDHILFPEQQSDRFQGSRVHSQGPHTDLASDHYLISADFDLPERPG